MEARVTVSGFRVIAALVVTLAVLAAGTPIPGVGDGTVAAQAVNPCALLPIGEIQPLALKATLAEGVATAVGPAGASACRFTWGAGVSRFRLEVIVNEASRLFPGMSPDLIRQRIQASPKPGTADAALADIGDAAVFKSDSPVLATTTAYLKGRILQLQLDGLYASDMKDQMIALLKSAVSRL
jgi:hypothetical protein